MSFSCVEIDKWIQKVGPQPMGTGVHVFVVASKPSESLVQSSAVFEPGLEVQNISYNVQRSEKKCLRIREIYQASPKQLRGVFLRFDNA